MLLPTLVVTLALTAEGEEMPPPPSPAPAAEVQAVHQSGPEEHVGAVFAPAILPRGAMTVYALLGAPEVGAGFRQGFASAELEARLLLNYLETSAVLEVGGKMSVYKKGILEFVPNLAIGIEGNTGSRYFDKANFGYVALRPRAALVTGIRFTEMATGIFLLDLPWSIALTNGAAGGHFSPTLGFGAEIQLSKTISGLLLGQIGVDVIKEPLGVTQFRPAWAVRLGLGFRLF